MDQEEKEKKEPTAFWVVKKGDRFLYWVWGRAEISWTAAHPEAFFFTLEGVAKDYAEEHGGEVIRVVFEE